MSFEQFGIRGEVFDHAFDNALTVRDPFRVRHRLADRQLFSIADFDHTTTGCREADMRFAVLAAASNRDAGSVDLEEGRAEGRGVSRAIN